MTLVWLLLLFLALPEIKRKKNVTNICTLYKADRTNNLTFVLKMEYFDKEVSNLRTGLL